MHGAGREPSVDARFKVLLKSPRSLSYKAFLFLKTLRTFSF